MTRLSVSFKVWLAILAFGVMVGAAFILLKVLVKELTPIQIATAQTVASATAVLAVMLVTRTPMPRSATFVRGVLVLAVLDGVAPYLLIAYGQVHLTSATGAILVSTMPLFTTVFAWLNARDQAPGPIGLLGMAGGFAGVTTLMGPRALDFGTDAGAMLAMLLGAACYAGATVYSRSMLKTATPLALAGGKIVVTAAILVPLAVTVDGAGNFATLSVRGWACVAAFGLGSAGLGRCLYLWAVGKAGSVKASLVTYIAPVVAIVLGWVVLGEAIEPRMLAGAGLIAMGVATVMFGRQIEGVMHDVLGRAPARLAPHVEP